MIFFPLWNIKKWGRNKDISQTWSVWDLAICQDVNNMGLTFKIYVDRHTRRNSKVHPDSMEIESPGKRCIFPNQGIPWRANVCWLSLPLPFTTTVFSIGMASRGWLYFTSQIQVWLTSDLLEGTLALFSLFIGWSSLTICLSGLNAFWLFESTFEMALNFENIRVFKKGVNLN